VLTGNRPHSNRDYVKYLAGGRPPPAAGHALTGAAIVHKPTAWARR
jgi:hypothetical protein